MRAYKFLTEDRTGRFSGFRWEPQGWVEANGAVDVCRTGIHACRLEQLPLWLDDELWIIELEDVVDLADVIVGRRGRLVDRIDAWGRGTACEFAASCVERAHQLAAAGAGDNIGEYADDTRTVAEAATSVREAAFVAFATAHAAEVAGPGGGRAERERQARWLRDRLGL